VLEQDQLIRELGLKERQLRQSKSGTRPRKGHRNISGIYRNYWSTLRAPRTFPDITGVQEALKTSEDTKSSSELMVSTSVVAIYTNQLNGQG
jgi:hypothetical protein